MTLMLDTNVILDLLLNRDNADNVIKLFDIAENKKLKLFVSASSITDIFYILRKETGDTKKTYSTVDSILKLVKIGSVKEREIIEALKYKWNDFEDCVQYQVALSIFADYIITANTKDYRYSKIEVRTVPEIIEVLSET